MSEIGILRQPTLAAYTLVASTGGRDDETVLCDFESHLLNEKPGVGLVFVYNGRPHRGLFFLVQNREGGATFPNGGFAIKFCPFCGKDLRELFESQLESESPSTPSLPA